MQAVKAKKEPTMCDMMKSPAKKTAAKKPTAGMKKATKKAW